MREKTQIFTVNGQPLPAPDADVTVAFRDVEAAAPVRDQDGFLHRSVIRRALADWTFRYSSLSEGERQALEALFPRDEDVFVFGHPHPEDISRTRYTTCYREDLTLGLGDARGQWHDCAFRIREV